MDPITSTDLHFEPDKLLTALNEILERAALHPQFMQLALTHSLRARTPAEKIYDGLGVLYDAQNKAYRRDPASFNIFNDAFRNSYLFEVYEQIKAWSPARLGRTRLMLRKPSSCYTMHRDESERFHIAITGNEECYFLFKNLGVYRIPTNGRVFRFDATKLHTGLNAGASDRIHLVIETVDWRFEPGKEIKILDAD